MSICRICKRVLKNPEHAKAGIGPVCAKKQGVVFEKTGTRTKNHVYDDFNGAEDVIVQRMLDGRVKTNVEQVHEVHSPDGFEFGYGGSGPADFAFNILIKFGCTKAEAYRWHQDFKFKYVAPLDQNKGGIIMARTIKSWIEHAKLSNPVEVSHGI